MRSRFTVAVERWARVSAATLLAVVAFLSLALVTNEGAAQEDKSGVSPSRLKLPKGPGSIEGIGENAEPNLSMGLMNYGVSIQVPTGYAQATPALRLAYSSGGGNSEVGLGWSLPVASIERMTSKGLPRYDRTDTFAAGGSDELVRIHASGVYRARYEGGFVRYTWIDPQADGRNGYFRAEYPDGRVGYFGARADGTIDENACVIGPSGVFRYQLVEMVDVLGHVIRYEYGKRGAYPTLRRIAYAFEPEGRRDPRYEVRFSYEERPDEISDARPGFDLRLDERLLGVQVLVRGVQLRRYRLHYHSPTERTFLSRLARVEQFGANDAGPYPIDFRFDYSGTTSEPCSGSACDSPEVIQASGKVQGNFLEGKTDLLDINGDGLPDVLDTSGDHHRFFVNRMGSDGVVAWSEAKVSEVAATVKLDQASVQTVDLDGNGFTDLVDTSTREGSAEVYWNQGNGDWETSRIVDDLGLPDFSLAQNLRFLDYDNDKQPDLLFNDGSSAFVYVNQGNLSFVEEHDVEPIGRSFAQVQLADMNGDGMQDAVEMAHGLVAYKLNLGFGRWSEWIEMAEAPEVTPGAARLADINGDGLSDLVSIFSDVVRYALNRNGRNFAAEVSIPVEETRSDTAVRLADINGSGSIDVVWITLGGSVSYLELFRLRPNLLVRIRTGAGKVIEAEYGSSVSHMILAAENRVPWLYHLPNPTGTLDALTTYDTLSGVRQTRRFEYRDGYYDGVEKQFRGFETVTVSSEGESLTDEDEDIAVFTASSVVTTQFDVGREDSYKKALLKRQIVRSDNRTLREELHGFDDCAVDDPLEVRLGGGGDLETDVRFICETSKDTLVTEGTDSEVALREAYAYDGYGNRTRTSNLGVVSIDGGACTCSREEDVFGAPCGNRCLGDESIEETDFVPPTQTGGRWILDKPSHQRRYGREGGELHTETIFYYDGPQFEGLPAGRLAQGLVRRTRARVERNALISTERVRHDEHGNPLEVLDAEDHRRNFRYDPTALFLISEEVVFDDRDEHYSLLMTASYHPLYETITEASSWILMQGGRAMSAEQVTRFEYDEFARLVKTAQPGDTLELPTETFAYEIASPLSRIVRRARSRSGGELDVAEIQCFDGLGRKYQTRSKIDGTRYQVWGFTAYDLQGNVRQEYQPYVGSDGACDTSAPPNVLSTRSSYDGTGRVREVTYPDGDIYGTPSVSRTRFEPLKTFAYDAEDTASGPHKDTPEVTIQDGLGRTTGIDRYLSPDDIMHTELTYDELGNLRGYVQKAQGEQIDKVQTYDLLGRVKTVVDPDSGETTFDYDKAGNVTREENEEHAICSEYDEANRLLKQLECGNSKTEIKYTYDRLDDCERCTHLEGQLARVTFPMESEDGEDLVGYDARSRVIYNRRELDGHAFEVSTELDNLGRVVAREYPTGTRIERDVDALGRLKAVPGYLSEILYDQRGLPSALAYANGVVTKQSYDELTRLKTLKTYSSSGTALQHYTYERDRVGNILSIADRSEVGEGPSANAEYDYDSWYRLTAARLDVGRVAEEHLDFGYDELDRISHKRSSAGVASPDHAGDYRYEGAEGAGPHAVTTTESTAGETPYRYDGVGNMRKRGQDTYRWDFLGRMTSAHRGNTVLGTYTYGAERNRVKKEEDGHVTYYVAPDFEVRDGTANLYLIVADQRVARFEFSNHDGALRGDLAPGKVMGDAYAAEPDGAITAGDACVSFGIDAEWLVSAETSPSDASELIRGALTVSARRHADSTGRPVFLHGNHLGTTALATDSLGGSLWLQERYPYGAPRYSDGGAAEPPAFSGKEIDERTELANFDARLLAVPQGRWLSPDPMAQILKAEIMSDRQAVDVYSFTGGNPINSIDATGLALRDVLRGAAAAVPYVVVGAVAVTVTAAVLPAAATFLAVAGAFQLGLTTGQVLTRRDLKGAALSETQVDEMAGGALVGWGSLGVAAFRSSPAPVLRTGPKGVDPHHHNLNVLVRNNGSSVITHERLVSGRMTPSERSLGFPKGPNASHTEARAMRNTPVQHGGKIEMTGQRAPCPSCKGKMNARATQTGEEIQYRWRDSGRTQTWKASPRED